MDQWTDRVKAAFRKGQQAMLLWLVRQDRQYSHASTRFMMLAWVGCVGLPLYYAVWTWWFPQEFESLPLRTSSRNRGDHAGRFEPKNVSARF